MRRVTAQVRRQEQRRKLAQVVNLSLHRPCSICPQSCCHSSPSWRNPLWIRTTSQTTGLFQTSPFYPRYLRKQLPYSFRTTSHITTCFSQAKFQSGFSFSPQHETALLRVTNNLLMTADSGSPSLLILLDLTAAFDTVDHTILERLYNTIQLTDHALQWFKSYLSDRTEHVSLGGCESRPLPVTCGVPQGSVLAPILFTIYMLGQVISKHGLSFHCYADDTQLYIKTAPNPSTVLSSLTSCFEEMKTWMNGNSLQLNSNKTEALLIGIPHQVHSSPFDGQIIPLSASATNLGVWFDPHPDLQLPHKNICAKPHSIISAIFQDSVPLYPSQQQNNWSMPSFPQGWTTITGSSSGYLAKSSRSCNTSKTAVPGSWWEPVNTSTSPPSFNHCTGSLSHPGSTTKFCYSPINASMDMHLYTSKKSSPYSPPPAPSDPQTPCSSKSPVPGSPPWETEPSARPHHTSGTASLPNWGPLRA